MKIYYHSIIGKRPTNEDEHISIYNINGKKSELNSINLFSVFDGHGGNVVSKFLKKEIYNIFMKTEEMFDNVYNKSSFNKLIYKIFDDINNSLKNNHFKSANKSGSTACILVEYKDKNKKNNICVINIGDSRAIKCNNTNIAHQLSNDHKPNQPNEKIRIEKLGGKIEYDGYDWRIKNLSLSRAFGDFDHVPFITHVPDIYHYRLNNKDKFIIIACDGLWDVISNQNAIDFILNLINNSSTKNYAQELVNYAYSNGSTDNITIIIYIL